MSIAESVELRKKEIKLNNIYVYCNCTYLVITYYFSKIEKTHKYSCQKVPQYLFNTLCILHLKLCELFTFLWTNAIMAFAYIFC